MSENITIIDFGGQYTHLIARRIRELGIYSEIVHPTDFIFSESIKGIILSGGPQSVTDKDLLTIPFDVLNAAVPVLGICYGHQLIATLAGGTVLSGATPEFGRVELNIPVDSPIFAGTATRQQVWMSHSDSVVTLPDDFISTASTTVTPVAAYRHTSKHIYGVQFHPEVTHSVEGRNLLRNFINLCTSAKNWDARTFSMEITEGIRSKAAGRKLLVLLSGGVDSLVAMAAAIRAVGKENVFAIHVDTGFMRLNESAEVMRYCTETLSANITLVSAGNQYFGELRNITEPEVKREIIGKLFVNEVHTALGSMGLSSGEWMLMQGTIYPDTIESGGTKHSGKIKTHHNTVKEIQELIERGLVIEPLRNLYKDEVRQLGYTLGLPEHLIERRPFPGPGLAIRILASSSEREEIINTEEEQQIQEMAKKHGLMAFILPVKSVGVQGDYRTYKNPVCLYSAEIDKLDWQRIKECAAYIVNSFTSVNRCVFSLLNTKPMWKKDTLFLEPETVHRLQIVDDIATTACSDIRAIWQMPVISLPLYDSDGKQVFVLRPITSEDAMTADVYEMPEQLLYGISEQILATGFATAVLYDVTTKPPGTIEWE